jgi:hypothetical protein
MELVERLRRKGIGPGPLSLHAIRHNAPNGRNSPNGLMIGYPNVPSAEAHAAAQRMLAAMR